MIIPSPPCGRPASITRRPPLPFARIALFAAGACLLTTAFAGPTGAEKAIPMKQFTTLAQKMKSGAPVTVAYLGGSITNGAGTHPQKGTGPLGEYDYSDYDPEKHSWRALTFAWLKENYETRPGQFEMIHAALGGTGSELGAYRYALDVGPSDPDLLFIEFVVNDAGAGPLSDDPHAAGSIYRTLKSIVSQARSDNPDIAIFMPFSTMRDFPTDTSQKRENVASSRARYTRAAVQYQIPFVDIAKAYFENDLAPEIDRERIFDGEMSPGNGVHPSPHGHKAFAMAVNQTVEQILNSGEFCFPPADALPGTAPFPIAPRVFLAQDLVEFADGWELVEDSKAQARYSIFAGKKTLLASDAGATLRFPFKGSAIALWPQFDLGAGLSGRMEVLLDGESVCFMTGGNPVAAGDRKINRYERVASGLDPSQEHILELRVLETAPVRLALHGICIDQGEQSGKPKLP
jgi:lysophospholipase L1-like esterase